MSGFSGGTLISPELGTFSLCFVRLSKGNKREPLERGFGITLLLWQFLCYLSSRPGLLILRWESEVEFQYHAQASHFCPLCHGISVSCLYRCSIKWQK